MSPIRPSERKRYPKNWKAISARIKARAGGRCECVAECGLHPGWRCRERDGQPALYAKGKIILTCAHLDRIPEHVEDGNLKAMCQRCHLRYDRPQHAENARKTRNFKRPYLPGMEPNGC